VPDDGADKCQCEEGWEGDRCDEEMGFDWTILVIVLAVLLVLVFIILSILMCVCCVMRNNNGGGNNEARPKPGPVTPSGPVVREIIIPPQSVQVVDVSKPPQSQQQVRARGWVANSSPQNVYEMPTPMLTIWELARLYFAEVI
jgi:hypothetical protein